jgi:heme o synthase
MSTAEYACKTRTNTWRLLTAAVLLSKPGILTLTALAGFTGMVMATGGLPDGRTSLPGLLSMLLAAAGSAMINGVLDASLDMRMQRVRARVEAMAELGRTRVALIASGLIVSATLISLIYLNIPATVLILAAALGYIFPYTLWLKRSSPFGVVPGGIPGGLPVLIGAVAVNQNVRPDVLILFFILLLWQPPHFWILALKYRDDYRSAGVPVLPVVMGLPYTKVMTKFYVAALIPASVMLGLLGHCSVWCTAFVVLTSAMFFVASYIFIINSSDYDRAFKASIWYLVLLFIALIADICLIRSSFPVG